MMRNVLLVLCVFGLHLAAVESSDAQAIRQSKVNSEETFACERDWWKTKSPPNSVGRDEEASYRFPIRYAVVYNEVSDLNVRRIEVLLDPKYFHLRNIIKVLCNINEKYRAPVHLEVELHTSLETVETPEERELLRDSEDSRFGSQHFKYRRASFSRFANGREALTYTVSLSPYNERMVVLKASPQ